MGSRGALKWPKSVQNQCQSNPKSAKSAPRAPKSAPRAAKTWSGATQEWNLTILWRHVRLKTHDVSPASPSPSPRIISRSTIWSHVRHNINSTMNLPFSSSWIAITIIPHHQQDHHLVTRATQQKLNNECALQQQLKIASCRVGRPRSSWKLFCVGRLIFTLHSSYQHPQQDHHLVTCEMQNSRVTSIAITITPHHQQDHHLITRATRQKLFVV